MWRRFIFPSKSYGGYAFLQTAFSTYHKMYPLSIMHSICPTIKCFILCILVIMPNDLVNIEVFIFQSFRMHF